MCPLAAFADRFPLDTTPRRPLSTVHPSCISLELIWLCGLSSSWPASYCSCPRYRPQTILSRPASYSRSYHALRIVYRSGRIASGQPAIVVNIQGLDLSLPQPCHSTRHLLQPLAASVRPPTWSSSRHLHAQLHIGHIPFFSLTSIRSPIRSRHYAIRPLAVARHGTVSDDLGAPQGYQRD